MAGISGFLQCTQSKVHICSAGLHFPSQKVGPFCGHSPTNSHFLLFAHQFPVICCLKFGLSQQSSTLSVNVICES